MEHMRRIAYETVLRACGFGSLAIFCVMIGLSFQPRAAFLAGGMLTMLMTAILMLKAYEAPRKNHRRTEMWLYLPEEHRPPEAYAQRACGVVLQETYLTVARWAAGLAVGMGLAALLFSAVGY
jgi:heme A synthase